VLSAGASRKELARTLRAAFAGGLISEETLLVRLDQVLGERLVEPRRVIGDLQLRGAPGGLRQRLATTMQTAIGRLEELFDDDQHEWTLLALDWSGEEHELMIGRHHSCDVVLGDLSVSRRHARLKFRDGRWVLQDLASTNGTLVNGRRVGRCELRPGDRVLLGDERLRID
jgi:hypothetical protein